MGLAGNYIRPYIENANSSAPAFSRVFRSAIIVVKPDKPLPRAGKGTVLRKRAMMDYEDEINAV